jgi:flagellar basal body-associated protein FliL
VADEKDQEAPSNFSNNAVSVSRNRLPIIPILNLVAALGTLGLLYYTKLIFKRPVITDSGERKRIAEEHEKPLTPTIPAYIQFQPQTISIQSNPGHPQPADGTYEQLQGKLHYLTIGLSLEIRDQNQQEVIENLRPYILDKLLTLIGRKPFQDLNSVQGRYLMQSQIIDLANQIIADHGPPGTQKDGVIRVFFTEFTLQ